MRDKKRREAKEEREAALLAQDVIAMKKKRLKELLQCKVYNEYEIAKAKHEPTCMSQ